MSGSPSSALVLGKASRRERLRELLPDLLAIIGPRRWLLIMGMILIASVRLTGMAPALAIKSLIDDVLIKHDPARLPLIVGVLCATGIYSQLVNYALTQMFSRSTTRLIGELRCKLQSHVMRLSLVHHDANKAGGLGSRIMNDVQGLQNLVGTGLLQYVGSLLTSVLALAFMTRSSPYLTVIAVVALAAIAVVIARGTARVREIAYARARLNSDVFGRLTEALGGVRVVKAYRAEEREERTFGDQINGLIENLLESVNLSSSLNLTTGLLWSTVVAVVMWAGAERILAGRLTVGEFVMFNFLLNLAVAPVLQIVGIGSMLMEAMAGLERTREIFRELREEDDPRRTVAIGPIHGDVAFDAVEFEYRAGKPVLQGFSFRAAPGTVTALVGPSGSGKSTTIGLIASFYNPTQGSVTVDGIDLSTVKLETYRSQLGVVLQETFLFAGTILENVAFARPDATPEQILAACRTARVDEFAERFEDKYDTLVGERGVMLSGGQRQRISIARALLADPRILILDEATSSLDSHSEALIQEALSHLLEGRTTFVIAHRLSTIRKADQILVVDGGRIVEHGTHAQLLAGRGLYQDMYTKQHHIEEDLFLAPGEGGVEAARKKPQLGLGAGDDPVGLLAPLLSGAMAELAIAVAASFTADPVRPSIACLLELLQVPHRIELAPYGQLLRELIDPASVLGRSRGVAVALVRLVDLGRREASSLRRDAGELASHAVAHLRREGAAPLLVCVCPEPRARLADAAYAALVAEVEGTLAAELRGAGAQVITSGELLAAYPVASWDDPAADELAHIPYTEELFAALGAMIARKLRALVTAPHKVLALDADNTLWSGVAGEDGPDGVVIDEGREAVQRFALAQREAGVLLCLCSRNVEEDVDAVFRRRSMPLAREHFAASRVGWGPKSEGLRSLAAELGVGLDAFVFVDDSLVECAEVRAGCPEVLTVQLPAGSSEAAALLGHVWAFDRWRVTDEDRLRGERYRLQTERELARRDAPSMAEFLAGLQLEIRIEAPEPGDVARVSQLTYRTNQLNFTTVRRSEAEVDALLRGGEVRCLKVHVADRFGDHGLVGVMLFGARDDALVVDTLLLSCRVLQRGVEHAMLARLGELAREQGLARVEVPLAFTAKNLPAQHLLRAVGEAWLTPREGGFTVRFPAEGAAALRYRPAAEAVDEAGPARAAPTALAGQSAVLESIARELTSAAAILARIAPRAAKKPRPALPRPLVAPRTETERVVAAICEEALGTAPVGVTDDLFLELGADSFSAVRIAAGMRERFGRDVQVVTVQEARTVERLAAPRPAVGGRQRSPSIHVLRGEGAKRPLFLARPATRSGGALSYAALVRHIDADRPVYVLQNRPLLDATDPYESVEQMAAEYLAAMREVQPRGPYLLAGWCLGGKTAFEIANQLAARGEPPATLLLFDTAAPGGLVDRVRFLARNALMRAELRAFSRVPRLEGLLPWVKVARARSMMRRFGVLAYYAPDDDDVSLIEYAFPGRFEARALRGMAPEARWSHVYAALEAAEPELAPGDGVDAASVRRGFRYFAIDHRMDALYAPRWVYPGAVEMFTVRGGTALAAGWRRFLARPSRVTEFALTATSAAPDPHSAMMTEENVKVMAAALHRVLGADD